MKNLIKTLKTKNLTLALAESCTSGYASYLITKTPGASKVFKGGTIVYSLESKNKLFKIPKSALIKAQGVSKEIALALAKGVRKKFNADIGAAITGFAGPSDKKTGIVFIAIAAKTKTTAKKLIIDGSRDTVRKQASLALINLIYELL